MKVLIILIKELMRLSDIKVNLEGQFLSSFFLGVIFSPYASTVIWLVLFFVIWEACYYLIYRTWIFNIRIGLVIAYLFGLAVGAYAIGRDYIPLW